MCMCVNRTHPCPVYFVFFVREVTFSFSAVGPQTVSLSQTIVSTGHIKQMEASVMVKVCTSMYANSGAAARPPATVENEIFHPVTPKFCCSSQK